MPKLTKLLKFMNSSDLKDKYLNYLMQFADSNRVAFSKVSIKTGLQLIGNANATIKSAAKLLKSDTHTFTQAEKTELVTMLVQSGFFELQILGFEFAGTDKTLLSGLTENTLLLWISDCDNWASVDYFSVLISGFCWRTQIVSDTYIDKLMNSHSVWTQRAAIVSTVALNLKSRGGKGDVIRTFWVCNRFINTRNLNLVKALSWALRELSKSYKHEVSQFIIENNTILHPQIVREVTKKITTGTKNPRQKK